MSRSILLILFMLIAGLTVGQTPETLLLKNFRPRSIYKTPESKIEKSRFAAVDMHSHPYAKSPADLKRWISVMDACGIQKVIVMTYATGAKFDSLMRIYSAYPDRFEVWCGFDYTGFPEKSWIDHAVAELTRCVKAGARGVGELGDKGFGEFYSYPVSAQGMHVDDQRMQPLFKKCGDLKIPVSIHVAEPMWMYQPMDSTNDGLMNAYTWRITKYPEEKIGHAELVATLQHVALQNPRTTFIACHYANCEYDLSLLGNLFESCPNLSADISARYAETATIPRYMKKFMERWQDRLLYATDMNFSPAMYRNTFRILESEDEHFYIHEYGYHSPLYGFGLSEKVLEKIYRTNAIKILTHEQK